MYSGKSTKSIFECNTISHFARHGEKSPTVITVDLGSNSISGPSNIHNKAILPETMRAGKIKRQNHFVLRSLMLIEVLHFAGIVIYLHTNKTYMFRFHKYVSKITNKESEIRCD